MCDSVLSVGCKENYNLTNSISFFFFCQHIRKGYSFWKVNGSVPGKSKRKEDERRTRGYWMRLRKGFGITSMHWKIF
jgi:hypothetical protein